MGRAQEHHPWSPTPAAASPLTDPVGRPLLAYHLRPFEQLDIAELYEVLRLRVDVFVVEQVCAYPEIDGHDLYAQHLLGTADGRLAAYCRWFEDEGRVTLGRIVVGREWRGRGWGKAITREAIRLIGAGPVRVHAQTRLEGFYRELGFEPVGEPYDDFGVLHLRMDRL